MGCRFLLQGIFLTRGWNLHLLLSCFLRCRPVLYHGTSPVAQRGKNLPPVRETWVQSPRQEGPLEEGMATHSSVLAWRILWTEEPGGLQPTGSPRVGHNTAT